MACMIIIALWTLINNHMSTCTFPCILYNRNNIFNRSFNKNHVAHAVYYHDYNLYQYMYAKPEIHLGLGVNTCFLLAVHFIFNHINPCIRTTVYIICIATIIM